MASKNLGGKILKGSAIVLLLTFFGSIFAYFIRILYSRTLSVEDYGLFYAVMGLFNVVTTYIDLGFGYSVVYLMPKYIREKKYPEAWNIIIHGQTVSFSITMLACFLLTVFAPFLSDKYFKVPGSESLIYIFCVYLIGYVALNNLIQIFSGMQKPKYYSSITVCKWFLTLVLSLIFFTLGFKNILYFAASLALGHLITAIIYLFLLVKNHSFLVTGKITLKRSTYTQMTRFALPSLLETIVSTLVITTDIFLLTLFKGVREVGVYNVIYPLASIPIVLFNPINALILPLVSHLMEGERDKLAFLIEKVMEVVPFISLYFVLFLIIFPSSIVRLIFGPQWGGLVELPLSILSVGAIGILMYGILGAVILGMGRVKEKLIGASIISVISVTINVILIWQYGILGAVITAGFVGLALTLFFTFLINKTISIKIPYLLYLKLFIFSFGLWLLTRSSGLNPSTWMEIIVLGLIYTLIYSILGFILRIYDRKLLSLIIPQRN